MSYDYYTNNNDRRQSEYSNVHGYSVPQKGNTVAIGHAGHHGQPAQHPGWHFWGYFTRFTPSTYQEAENYTQIKSPPQSQVCIVNAYSLKFQKVKVDSVLWQEPRMSLKLNYN